MTFVREVNELARNAKSLQSREELVAFADWNPEVEIVVDDQHRSLEVGSESMRTMLFV